MYHYDRGFKLTAIDLALDVRRRQRWGFISHAHADHYAPHELTLCTAETAALLDARYGPRQRQIYSIGQPLEVGDWRLSLQASGHMLGSAMLLADDGRQRLLFTGDFQLAPSRTAMACAPPQADILIMECTFGEPRFQFPPREELWQRLVQTVRNSLDLGRIPVIHAYVSGKAQEIARLLADHGIPTIQHPAVYAISRIYQQQGCDLGEMRLYEGQPLDDGALLMPPPGQVVARLPLPARRLTIGVTGWALCPRASRRWRVDCLLPFSDHADFPQLVELVERVQPREVVCTHGSEQFSEHLRDRGFNARYLA